MSKEYVGFKLSKRLYDEFEQYIKEHNMTITTFMTNAVIHELHGDTELDMAVYEVEKLKDFVNDQFDKLVTQQNVKRTVKQNKEIKRTVKPSSITEINDLTVAIEYVKNKTEYRPFIPSETMELLANQCGLTLNQFCVRLKEAEVNFIID